MHFATGHGATTRGFLVFTATESAPNFVDLLPLIEKTENLDILRCNVYCVFSHYLSMKMAPSYLSLARQENGANTVTAPRFWLAAYIVRLFDYHFSLVYFNGLKYILARQPTKFSILARKMEGHPFLSLFFVRLLQLSLA